MHTKMILNRGSACHSHLGSPLGRIVAAMRSRCFGPAQGDERPMADGVPTLEHVDRAPWPRKRFSDA
jgi:hypothetical protein